MDFGPKLDKILKLIPKERTTYLFSATMTTKVAKLQRASLSDPVRVEVNFGVPLVASKSDGVRKGFQVGIGLDFL